MQCSGLSPIPVTAKPSGIVRSSKRATIAAGRSSQARASLVQHLGPVPRSGVSIQRIGHRISVQHLCGLSSHRLSIPASSWSYRLVRPLDPAVSVRSLGPSVSVQRVSPTSRSQRLGPSASVRPGPSFSVAASQPRPAVSVQRLRLGRHVRALSTGTVCDSQFHGAWSGRDCQ